MANFLRSVFCARTLAWATWRLAASLIAAWLSYFAALVSTINLNVPFQYVTICGMSIAPVVALLVWIGFGLRANRLWARVLSYLFAPLTCELAFVTGGIVWFSLIAKATGRGHRAAPVLIVLGGLLVLIPAVVHCTVAFGMSLRRRTTPAISDAPTSATNDPSASASES